MQMKWLALIVFVYVIGMYLGSTFEYHSTVETWAGSGSVGLSQAPTTTLEYVTNLRNIVQRQEQLGGAITFPAPNPEYFDAVFKMVTWRFDFVWYDDLGRMFYWHVLAPFVVASVASLIMLIYGVIFGTLSWS